MLSQIRNFLLSILLVGFSLSASAFSICAVGDSITEGASGFTAHRVALERRFDALGWDVEWKGSHIKAESGSSNLCEGFSGKNAEEIAENYKKHAESIVAKNVKQPITESNKPVFSFFIIFLLIKIYRHKD